MRRSKRTYSISSSASCCKVLRNFEAERFRSFEIDDRLELGRRLTPKVGWSFTFKDTIDVPSRASNDVDTVRSIGDQCPFRYVWSRKSEELNSWWPGRKMTRPFLLGER